MSISGMLVSGALPYTAISKPKSVPFSWSATGGGRGRGIVAGIGNGTTGLVVECSSRPQKKATAHHMKTRPKKTQPWDVKRKGPTQYPSLPALPPDWTLVGHQEEEQQQQQQEQEVEEVPSSSE